MDLPNTPPSLFLPGLAEPRPPVGRRAIPILLALGGFALVGTALVSIVGLVQGEGGTAGLGFVSFMAVLLAVAGIRGVVANQRSPREASDGVVGHVVSDERSAPDNLRVEPDQVSVELFRAVS